MTILYFVLAALALGILVFIHELGHYFVAKKTGMIVEVFSIGFGRPILKWKWQNVDWQVGWLPFGGYVKILGMEVSKKDTREPYEIPNGFFSKSPWRRIAVAVAGPMANFILAFLIFLVLWGIGGREKPFSEYTQVVGWVDPSSQIYSMGMRPGDIISSYNGKSFTGSKDLLYAAMLAGDSVDFEGEHVNYSTGEKKPFSYSVKPYPMPNVLEDLETTGVMATGSYLIYEPGSSEIAKTAPIVDSGLKSGDRLVWADGELLFSMQQLSAIANSSVSLLTVQRGETTFLSKQPRVLIDDLSLLNTTKDDFADWRYEMELQPRLAELYTVPYRFDASGTVEGQIAFIDEWSRNDSQVLYPQVSAPLQAGDRIIAVDGTRVASGMEAFARFQSREVSMIVERGVPLTDTGSWKEADLAFDHSWDVASITAIEQTLGTKDVLATAGNYTLLKPVEPKPIFEFTLSQVEQAKLEQELAASLQQVADIKDSTKRQMAGDAVKASYTKRIFGVPLIDQRVRVNPGPIAMFGTVFAETWQTLKALVMGYLHPKWLSGPVGIVRVIHHGWRVGIGEALFWIGAISVNLGFLNLMPVPVLDGGYICLALLEKITKRRLKARTMEKIVIPFVVLLIALLVFLTFQDISRLF